MSKLQNYDFWEEGIKMVEQKDWSSTSLLKSKDSQLKAEQSSPKWTRNLKKIYPTPVEKEEATSRGRGGDFII